MGTAQKVFAEALGTALLLAIVIGSGIMGERLAGGNVAVALVVKTLSTVSGLYILIEGVRAHQRRPLQSGRVGGHGVPGPAATPVTCALRHRPANAVVGAWIAHAMFDMSILQFSTKVRSGTGQWFAEVVATAGLLLVILRAPAARVAAMVAAMVAAYIGSAYFFTTSTSFANPAAAFGRMFTHSFAGIAPSSVPGFIVAQLLGAALAVAINSVFVGAPVAPEVSPAKIPNA